MRVVACCTHFLLGHRSADPLELHWLWSVILLLKVNLFFQKLGDLGVFHQLLELIYRNVVGIGIGQLGDHLRLSVLALLLVPSHIALLQVLFACIMDCVAVRVVLARNHLGMVRKLLLILLRLDLQICISSYCAHFRILVLIHVRQISCLVLGKHAVDLTSVHALNLGRLGALIRILLAEIQIAIDILLTRLAFILIKLVL